MPLSPARRRERYAERVAAGLCVLCGLNATPGLKVCRFCSDERAEWKRKRRAARKDGAPKVEGRGVEARK